MCEGEAEAGMTEQELASVFEPGDDDERQVREQPGHLRRRQHIDMRDLRRYS